MDVVHISKENQENVFAMLAAVLWLGNVSFTVIDNENHVQPVEDEGKKFLDSLKPSTTYLFCMIDYIL